MASLWNWLKGNPAQPARVPTDTIIPLHHIDSNKMFINIVMDLSLRYDHVIDVEKLVGALERLLEKPGWRKLGARIRRNESGKYEYHIPAVYTKERSAISFSHIKYDIPLAEHPIGSKLPQPNGTIQVSGDTKAYRPLFVPENNPKRIEDWLYADRAQIVLNIVSFEDATLITLTWLHSLMDAVSLKLLLNAWTAMLEGREQDVPEFYGELEDPLATLGVALDPKLPGDRFEEEEFVLKDRLATGWAIFRFVFNMLWDLLAYRKEELRYIVIPPAVLSSLRAESLASLTAPFNDPKTAPLLTLDRSNPPTPSNPEPPPFLSNGDILCAWWTRLITASLPPTPRSSPTRTIQILNVFNMQDLLSSTAPALLPKGRAYVHNCVTCVQSFFTLHELLTLPLGHIAARLRSDIVLQTTRPQIEARWRLQREEEARTGNPPLYGEGDMQMSPFSNWYKARIFDVDFGAAVVGRGSKEGGVVAKPVYAMPDATIKGIVPLRTSGNLAGRDGQGNWWVGGILTAAAWRNVMKVVETYNVQERADGA